MFVNISNHNSDHWSAAQREAAMKYGEIVDIAFPSVDPKDSAEAVERLAEQYVQRVMELGVGTGDAVHVMGEMTFCYALIGMLRDKGIVCVASTTERIKVERPDGTFITEFNFQQFRRYR